MRELLENALYAPTAGRYKVYIIDEVHMLSRNAFNAMLKTLEEPPEHVKFVLATTDPQKMPVTVLSRCLQFNLKQIPPPQIQAQLEQDTGAEGIAVEDAGAGAARACGAGQHARRAVAARPGDRARRRARRARRPCARCWARSSRTYLHDILRALAARDGAALIAEADRMAERSLSFEMALQELATLLHRLALVQTVPQAIAAEDPDARRARRSLRGLFDAEETAAATTRSACRDGAKSGSRRTSMPGSR